jgi:hypothetical protein
MGGCIVRGDFVKSLVDVLFLVPLEGEVSKECVLLSSVGLSSFP